MIDIQPPVEIHHCVCDKSAPYGIRYDGCWWWAFLTVEGMTCDIYHAFETESEALSYLHEYLNLIKDKKNERQK